MTTPRTARTNRANIENEMIKRREKEYKHQMEWGGRVQYYKTFEKSNNKYEQWTSPRYYEENFQLMDNIRKKREKEELLQKRREKLIKLYQEEEASYKIELMVKTRNNYLKPRNKQDDIPTEILEEINKGLKLEEEDRRRHQAELSLYEHWRHNNHNLRNYERRIRTNDVKLSWLDQQIQKRMEKEKEEEECRKLLADREKRLQEQKDEEESFKKHIQDKNKQLREDLDQQLAELEEKQKLSDKLRMEEDEVNKLQQQIEKVEELQKNEELKRRNCEIALYNITHHKMKLKQKAQDIENNLENERKIAEEILKIDLAEKLENRKRKEEIQKALKEFIEYTKEQKRLEKQRQEYLNFLFDSEAKLMYEKQCEIWQKEEKTRGLLLKDVLDTIKKQIKQKEEAQKEAYLRVLDEREEVLKHVEKYNTEMDELKEQEKRKNNEYKKIIDKQIKERDMERKHLRTLQEKDIDKQLELAKKEEARIKDEIMKLQRRQGPVRYPRRRIIY